MATWPEVEELKRVLDVDPESTVWEDTLDRILASAIARVKSEVGNWDEYQEPTDAQSQAALRMAELLALRPDAAPASVSRDSVYVALLYGSRRRFGLS